MHPPKIHTSQISSLEKFSRLSSNQDALTPSSVNQDINLKLILVRHAESTINALRPRIVQGQSDPPLTELGKKQAYFLAHRLSKLNINCIYTSDLQRAVDTAKMIAEHHKKPILKDKRLREQSMGNLTGKPWREIKKMLKNIDNSFQAYVSSQSDGETTSELKLRLVEFYVDLIEKHILQPFSICYPTVSGTRVNQLISNTGPLTPSTPSSRPLKACIVVVTHGGPILQLLKHFQYDLNFSMPGKVSHPYAFPKGTSLYEIQLERRYSTKNQEFDWKGSIHLINCVSHLAGLENYSISPDVPPISKTDQSQSFTLVKKKKDKKIENSMLPNFSPQLEELSFGKRNKSLGW